MYDPSKIIEQWFDRSHNAFLDYFAQYGVFGFALSSRAHRLTFAARAFQLYRREPPVLKSGPPFSFFSFSPTRCKTSLSLIRRFRSGYCTLFLHSSLSRPPDAPTTPFRRLPLAVSALVSVLLALLIVPAVAPPFYANVLLTKGYLFHLTDVNRANAYFERGLALGTYADLEYGYQAYNMYTERQAVQLSGKDRVAAYEYALSVLTANFKKVSV